MGFSCGIVGLPNVGKSTLFNALTASTAAAANYPFCTVDPNVGQVAVPDPRLEAVARAAASPYGVPARLEFVDIAGLVRGASRGEGLGNRFLGHIREVDAVIHVLRCFGGEDVGHVEADIDPLRDAEIVATELLLADIDSLERRVEAAAKRATGGDREARDDLRVMEPARAALHAGRPVRDLAVDPADAARLRGLHLLTAKPVLYALNVDEASAATGNALSDRVAAVAVAEGAGTVVISARIEAEIALIADPGERAAFLGSLGLREAGLDRLVRAGYRLLDLVTFFTAGPKEARARTVQNGATAVEAASLVHSDFARGFIRADTIDWADLVDLGGEAAAREAGRMRQEGRDYRVRDGDVISFRFNV